MKFIPFFSFARKQLFARFRSKQVLVEQAHSQEELLWEFALYVEGQDDLLDEWIVGLRQQLRSSDKVIDGALITAAHEAMSSAVTARRNSLDKQLQSFNDGVAQLLALNPPAEAKKKLAAFMRGCQQAITSNQPADYMAVNFFRLQGLILNDLPKQSIEGEEIESIAERLEAILADILSQLKPIATTESALISAHQILSEGLNNESLLLLLNHLKTVIIGAHENDHQEFELFLKGLNDQLFRLNNDVSSVGDSAQSIIASGASFERAVRDDIDIFSGSVETASSMQSLQASVRSHVALVSSQLDEYQKKRDQQQRDYEIKLAAMRSHVQLLEAETARAEAELEVQRRYTELDGLTELPNREAYDRRIAIELERSNRYGNTFCLVVLDVDRFKVINDTYGHLAGDKVLKLLAKTAKKRLRSSDYIARYGGEEFVILLPETDADSALKLMNDICAQVRNSPFHFQTKPLKITVSLGIAEVAKDDSAEDLFSRADKAMYHAKDMGRDQCQVAA